MKEALKDIYVVVRFLTLISAIVLAFLSHNYYIEAIVLVFSLIYFSFVLYSYYNLRLSHLLSKYIDIIYYPLILISLNRPEALFLNFPYLALFGMRSDLILNMIFIEGLIGDIYLSYLYKEAFVYYFVLSIALYIASSSLDIKLSLKKERQKVKHIKKSYKDLLTHFAKWEKDQILNEYLKFVLESIRKTTDINEFIEKIKERFDIEDIFFQKKLISESFMKKDKENNLLIFYSKEHSYVCVFKLFNYLSLYDENLIEALEYTCLLINLYSNGAKEYGAERKAI